MCASYSALGKEKKMVSLHSMLVAGNQLPMLVGAGAGVLIAVAFIVGFFKGFRKVGWGGLIWLTAGLLFALVGILVDASGSETRQFVVSMLFALLYVSAALVAYGVLARFLRPRVRWVKDNVNGDTTLAEYGLEFEPEYLDYDGENDAKPYGKMIYKTGFQRPKFIGRLLGGLACALNVAMILWAIISVVLIGIYSTSMVDLEIGTIFQNDIVMKLLYFAQRVLLDWLCIGLIIAIAKKGFEKGLMNSIRGIIVSLGTTAAVVFGFYLPFSPMAAQTTGLFYYLNNFITRCANALGDSLPFANILAKVLAGACLAVACSIVMVFVNLLLKKCCKLVSASAPTRMLDKILSCILYMIIGAAVCLGIWIILAILEHFGLFNISEAISSVAYLSKGLFAFAKSIVGKMLGGI